MIEPAQTPPGLTGRRKLTAGQVRAQEYPPPRSDGPDRKRTFAAFKRAGRLLGVGGSVMELLDLLASLTQDQDWDGAGQRPIVWPTNLWIGERLGWERSQVRRVLNAAHDAGLIAMRDSGNGRRWGDRDKAGRIRFAYGIDLSPLAARHAEFLALAEADDRRMQEARRVRRDLSALKKAVLELAHRGAALEPETSSWRLFEQHAHQIGDNRGWEHDPDVLRMLLAQMRKLNAAVAADLDRAEAWAGGRKDSADSVDSNPKGFKNEPHITTTTQPDISNDIAKPAGRPAVERMQSGGAERSGAAACGVEPPQTAIGSFPATPEIVAAIAPLFKEFTPSERPDQADIVKAAERVRQHLGIRRAVWEDACRSMGGWPASVALAAIVARDEAGELRGAPGQLFHWYVYDGHPSGRLRLDRTLWGIVDRLQRDGRPQINDPLAALRRRRSKEAGPARRRPPPLFP